MFTLVNRLLFALWPWHLALDPNLIATPLLQIGEDRYHSAGIALTMGLQLARPAFEKSERRDHQKLIQHPRSYLRLKHR